MRLLFLLASCLILNSAQAQGFKDPSVWTMEVEGGNGDYKLVFNAKLNPGWHIWSLSPGGDGTLIPPAFVFQKGAYTLVDTVAEKGKLTQEVMEGIDGPVRFYANEAKYLQKIKAKKGDVVKGEYTYQLCNDQMCLPPKTVPFTFQIP